MIISGKHVLTVASVLVLGACVDPRMLETTPRVVHSSKGTVVCQLYSPN